jgi:general L-amino acid transport system permease protein
MTSSPTTRPGPGVAPWRDVRVLRVAAQVLVVALVGLLVAYLLRNLLSAMDDRGLGFGFGFLDSTAGFEIRETPIPYSATDTYGEAFLVGLLNTLFVSAVGIVLATVLGLVVGVARLSRNFLVNRVTAGYVEVIRNTPLLVQLFFLYAFLLQLPGVADSVALPGGIFLNQRGLSLPAPVLGSTFGAWLAFVVAGVAIAIAARRFLAYGRRWIGLLAILLVPLAGWLVLGEAPIGVDVPALQRFNFTGGMTLSSGFTALLVGLVLYTAAFIGEVVRGGILAVRRGQVEAARALGLSEGHILRLVVFPQALRVIVPPLTSQYLNLAKNSSLAIAIGYPDLFSVSQTMANQTGQPVSVIAMVMGTYLAISLVTSLLMNLYNRRVQVLER